MTLKITNLQKQFNNRLAVDIPHLTIDSGECFGLVGENGAGKTTLLRAMLDLVDVDRGGIQIENNDVSKTSDWKANTSSFLGESFLIDFLTPYEFFLFVGSAYGISKANVDSCLNDYQDFLANDDFYDETKLIRDLSSGVVQKVGLMSALLVKPRLLILDEPFTHLDPKAQLQFKNILKEINSNEEITILVSSHNIAHVSDLCTRIAIMDKGLIVRDLETNADTLSELTFYFKPHEETQ